MDAVYIVRPGDHNEELRYSLRSVAAHLRPDRLWIVGHLPPWVTGVHHIPGNRHDTAALNVHDNLAIACAEIPAETLVILNDDFYLMRPVTELPAWWRCPLDEHIAKVASRGPWKRSLEATRTWLTDRGFTDPRSYELHVPVEMDRDRLAWVLDETRGPAEPPQWRTIYGNHFWPDADQHPDCKARTNVTRVDLTLPFLSTEDFTFGRSKVGRLVRSTFTEPCTYETDPPSEEDSLMPRTTVKLHHPATGSTTVTTERRAEILVSKADWQIVTEPAAAKADVTEPAKKAPAKKAETVTEPKA